MEEDDKGDYVDGPAEIIWEGDKIFVKKKRVKVAEGSADKKQDAEVYILYAISTFFVKNIEKFIKFLKCSTTCICSLFNAE